MKKGRLKRGVALLLSTMTLSMSVIPHLPPNILTAYAFHMTFNTSTSGDGHYDIKGAMPNQPTTDFLCMKKGASAKSAYNYYKTDNDVNYSEGSLEHKRLFWAYMLTYGNTTGIHPQYNDHSIEGTFGQPYVGNTKVAKEVAWSHGASSGGSALVESLAHDGFMSLENIPAGCKSPNDVFNSTSKYGTPEKAISVDALKSGPNTVDAKLLYDMAGLQDWATFQKYCTITASPVKGTGPASSGVEYPVRVDINDAGFGWTVLNPENGFPVAKLEHDPIIFHVEYNPSIFKVINVTGLIEYFETNDAGGKDSQPFYRAFGKVEVTKPQFYMTTQWKPNSSDVPGGGGSSGGGGGDLDEVDSITVKIYDHSETFNSHYKVDLTKYDYETGEPLKDSIWQVLEAFPDKDQIGTNNETNGQLVESKMREAPTTWDDWLIFEEDMATDENGYISHADERFYDFDHKYCDGHPIPPEPEDEDDDDDTRSARSSDDDDDDDDDDEYAELMKEWQAAVDECEAAAASSNGTFHHWMCNSEEEPSEEEAFEVTNPTNGNRNEYGETDDTKTKPQGSAWVKEKLKHVVTFPEGNAAYGKRENLFDIAVGSNNATNGFNVVFDGIPEGADFYFDNVTTKDVTVQVPDGGTWEDATTAPLYLTADGSTTPKKDIDGNPIANPNAVPVPSAFTGVGVEAKKITSTTAQPSGDAQYTAAFTTSNANVRYVKYELEQMMRSMGIKTPKDSATGLYSQADFPVYDEPSSKSNGMPEEIITISNVTTNASLIKAILDYYVAKRVYTYGSLQKVELNGDTAKVTVAIGMNPQKSVLYETDDSGNVVAGYLFKLNPKTNRYVMRKYTGTGVQVVPIQNTNGKANVVLAPDFTINDAGMPQDVTTTMPGDDYLYYAPGETLYDYWYQDGSGDWVGHSPSRRKVYVPKFKDEVIQQSTTNTSKIPVVSSKEAVKDPVGSTYVVYDPISQQYTLHAGSKDADLGGVKSSHFTVAIDNGSTTLTQNDIDKIGKNNVWQYKVGDSISNSAYIMRIAGAGAGVFTSEDFNNDTSFIKNQRLIYNGCFDLAEDGNTDTSPNPVEERIISQRIKVTKKIDDKSYNNTDSYRDVHEDWFTKTFGTLAGVKANTKKMDNFRFKVYLKSNLERLYRDNDGNVL